MIHFLQSLELSLWYLAGSLLQCLMLLRFRLKPKDKGLLAVPAVFFAVLLIPSGDGALGYYHRFALYSLLYGLTFCALFYDRLLPRLSETVLLFYTLIFWYAYLSFRPLNGALELAALSLALLFSLLVLSDWLYPRPHGSLWRYLGYLWFLAISLALAAMQYSQHQSLRAFLATEPGLAGRAELFLSGMSFMFLTVVSSLFISILPLDLGRDKKDRRLVPGPVWASDLRMIDRRSDPRALSFGMGALLITLEGGLFVSNARYAYLSPWLMIQFAILAVPLMMSFAQRLAGTKA